MTKSIKCTHAATDMKTAVTIVTLSEAVVVVTLSIAVTVGKKAP